MSESHKLSLTAAILVNLNIMMGAGIFINTVELAKRSGILGFISYGIVGILLLPLIVSIAQLMNMYPEGGFFTYAKEEISPLAAFVSTWSYFIGKLGSATLLIHTAFLLLQQVIPILGNINVFALDSILLSLFIFLNLFNLKTGETIQAWLMAFKLIPILFVIFSGLYFFNPSTTKTMNVILSGIPYSIPLVLFTFLGFEASCSLSSNIANARRNGPLAIFISYAIVILLYMSYQFFFYTSLGNQLATFASYLNAFPALLNRLVIFNNPYIMQTLLNCAIASSALGGSYGVLFSNSWNFYMLAKKDYVPFSSFFRTLNNQMIPYLCVCAEGIICLFYLWVSQGEQIPLQLTSVLGSITAYTLSVFALLIAYRKKNKLITVPGWLIYCAVLSCSFLIFFCLRNVIVLGSWKLLGFFGLLVLGIIIFSLKEKNNNQ